MVSASAGCLLIIWLLPSIGLAARSMTAAITATPAVAPPSTKFTLIGHGFGPSEVVDLAFDTAVLKTATADSGGVFSATIRVPASARPGSHVVMARGESSGTKATTTFTVRTDWPKAHFDLANTGYNPYENTLSPSTVSGLIVKWAIPTLGSALGDIAVVSGVAYASTGVTGDGYAYTYAIDARTGRVLWRHDVRDGLDAMGLAVSHGRVFVSILGCHCMQALDAKTGDLLWIFYGPTDVPTVADEIVYVGSDIGYFYAIDARNGRQRWRIYLGDGVFDAAAVVGGILYAGSQTNDLYAIDRETGGIVWTFTTGNDIVGSPSVNGDIVYVGSWDEHLYAVSAKHGDLMWTKATNKTIGDSPTVADGVVYVGSEDHRMYAFDAETGSSLWATRTNNEIVGQSAALANGVLYGANNAGTVFALDAATGRSLWRYRTGLAISTDVTLADGVVYVGSQDHHLYAFALPN